MANNAIHLAGDYRKIQSLAIASGQSIKPGMLVELASATTVTVHASEGGEAERMIAHEDALQGDTKTTEYTAETIATLGLQAPGSESQVLVASGEDIEIGDQLMSAGNGKFKEFSDPDSSATLNHHTPLAVALEEADLSSSGAVDTLVKVRWL
jgi:hypothetical protein